MASSAVGVDIGTRTITVAEVATSRGSTVVTNFGGAMLPMDAVQGGEIMDPLEVVSALKDLLDDAKIKAKKVWLGVANQRVVVRQVDLPWMEESELRGSLRYQVQEHIPIPVEEAELDVHIVDEFTSDEGDRMQRLMLVAGHRDMINAHVSAATEAGLKPIGVDLNPFAILRAMGDDSMLDQGRQVLVDVGAGVTNIVVHQQGVPTFVRMLVNGGDDITRALSSGLSMSPEDAEAFKRSAAVGNTDDAGARIVTEQADAFIDEVRGSLDYYQHHQGGAGGPQLGGVVLSGGGASLVGLRERLEAALRLPVELGDPFARYPAKNTVYGAEDLQRVGPSLVTAIGLALGGLE
ncbi:MAG: type IV pilus assembly protein PilM [Nitriliruptoraceae bacterium]|nr:type IV pilus assembly protein PilM [Nitriliruptoraceae bacterium]